MDSINNNTDSDNNTNDEQNNVSTSTVFGNTTVSNTGTTGTSSTGNEVNNNTMTANDVEDIVTEMTHTTAIVTGESMLSETTVIITPPLQITKTTTLEQVATESEETITLAVEQLPTESEGIFHSSTIVDSISNRAIASMMQQQQQQKQKIPAMTSSLVTTATEATSVALDTTTTADASNTTGVAVGTTATTGSTNNSKITTTMNADNNSSSTIQHKSKLRRKKELLLEARQDRINWIYKAPLPYDNDKKKGNNKKFKRRNNITSTTTTNNVTMTDMDDDIDTITIIDPRVKIFQSTYACSTKFLPSACSILTALHQMSTGQQDSSSISSLPFIDNTTASNTSTTATANTTKIPPSTTFLLGDELEKVLGESLFKDVATVIPTGKQIVTDELQVLEELFVRRQRQQQNQEITTTTSNISTTTSTTPTIILDEYDIVKYYNIFLTKLQHPTCLSIVQNIRSFCTNVQNNVDDDDPDSLLVKLMSYLQVTYDTIESNTIFNKNNNTVTTTNSGTLSASTTVTQTGTTSSYTTGNNNNKTTSSIIGEVPESEDNKLMILMMKRSLESFIFSHCSKSINTILFQSVLTEVTKENEWKQKLQSLSFIEAKHLDISCLSSSSSSSSLDNNNDATIAFVDDLLAEPISILLSIDSYYSVNEKLFRILALYRSVNVALSNALNNNNSTEQQQHKDQKISNKERKLPSADDVLPTIILVVIKGQPNNLLFHLKAIEQMCSPETLRGEAGYAYTNLYGAVQFILELNTNISTTTSSSGSTDNDNDGTNNSNNAATNFVNGLSISLEEYKAGIQRSRDDATALHNKYTSDTLVESEVQRKAKALAEISLQKQYEDTLLGASRIPPHEIRNARIRGEIIDTDWAIRYYEQNGGGGGNLGSTSDNNGVIMPQLLNTNNTSDSSSLFLPPTLIPTTDSFDDDDYRVSNNSSMITSNGHNQSTITTTQGTNLLLPIGFQRKYTFLSTKPEDVRVTDLPILLDEYRMLVHTTEQLLAEKALNIKNAKKAIADADEKKLFDHAHSIDPSLLPKF